MLKQITNPVLRQLNSARLVNHFSGSNAAEAGVVMLVVANGTIRTLEALRDKKENPATRNYAAAIAALQEGFALSSHFLLTPLFAVGGLLAGKHLMARGAFKALASKGVNKIGQAIKGVHRHNETVLNGVRQAVQDGKQIVIKTAENTFKPVVDNKKILGALEGEAGTIRETITKEAAESGNNFITSPLKFLGDDRAIHNNVLGSRNFGKAIGMATALTVVSPMISIKLAPFLLKKLGLAKEGKKQDNVPEQIKPKFNLATRLKKQGFSY